MEAYSNDMSYKKDPSEKIVKSCSACLLSVLVSMIGGLLLGWWLYQHHPTNTQLWMVPFGLVLSLTPLIVTLSVFFSDLFNLDHHHHHDASMEGQHIQVSLVHDLENNTKQATIE